MFKISVLIYIWFLVKFLARNMDRGITVIVYMMFAVPYCSYNKLLEQLSMGSIAGFNLNIILISAMFLFLFTLLRSSSIRMASELKLMFLLFASYFIGLSISPDFISALQDYNKFLLQIIWGLCFYVFLQKRSDFDVEIWQITCLNALTLGCLIFMLGKIFEVSSIFNSELNLIDDGVVGSWFTSCLIMSFGYMGYEFSLHSIIFYNKQQLLKLFICLVYLLFFQQSRTSLVFCAGAFAASYLVVAFSEKRALYLKRNIVLLLCSFILVPLFLVLFEESNVNVINRLLNTDIFSRNDTLLTRINTILYYSERIKKRCLTGYGFGVRIPLVNQNGNFHGTGSFYTDNALINVGMKSGIISLIIFIAFWITPLVRVLKYKQLKKNVFVMSMSITYFFFLFAAMFMTSQINHNYMVGFCAITNTIIMYYFTERDNVYPYNRRRRFK